MLPGGGEGYRLQTVRLQAEDGGTLRGLQVTDYRLKTKD